MVQANSGNKLVAVISVQCELFFFFNSYMMHRLDPEMENHSLFMVFGFLVGYLLMVPAGSPSSDGSVTVYVVDINQPSLPTLFILFLCLFLSLWPFRPYFILHILPTTLRFLTLFFWSDFCLTGPFNYIFLYENLPQL